MLHSGDKKHCGQRNWFSETSPEKSATLTKQVQEVNAASWTCQSVLRLEEARIYEDVPHGSTLASVVELRNLRSPKSSKLDEVPSRPLTLKLAKGVWGPTNQLIC